MAYIRCWNCNGNGLVKYPREDVKRCEECGGTGADYEKTKKTRVMSESEKTYPSPLPKLKSEKNNPTTQRFSALKIGQSFDFISHKRHFNSFYKRCWKISKTQYQDEDGGKHKVGSSNVKVFHVEAENPRKRKYRVRKNFKKYSKRSKVSRRRKSRRGKR